MAHVQTFIPQTGQLKPAGLIVSHLADVTCPQSQPLAGDQSSCDLASCLPRLGDNALLSTQGREAVNQNHRVGGVEPQPDNINLRSTQIRTLLLVRRLPILRESKVAGKKSMCSHFQKWVGERLRPAPLRGPGSDGVSGTPSVATATGRVAFH